MVPLTFGRDIFNEGTFAQAACIITDGDEPLAIQWSFHGHNISSDQGITTANIGSRTSILSIGSVSHNHRGNYTCRASNLAGDRSYMTELKVNGRHLVREKREEVLMSQESSSTIASNLAITIKTSNHFSLFQSCQECYPLVLEAVC
jgi:hypothetical protein